MDRNIDLEHVPARLMATVRFHATGDDVGDKMGPALGTVMTYLVHHGVEPAGPAVARYQTSGDGFDVDAGFIVATPVGGDDGVRTLELPAGEVAHLTHLGGYDDLPAAYATLHQFAETMGRRLDDDGPMWEEYWSGPQTPADEIRTEIYWPVAVG